MFKHVFRWQQLWPPLRERRLSCLRHSAERLGRAVLKSEEVRCLVEEARTPRKSQLAGRRPPTSRALGDGSGRWLCCDCGIEKTLADFGVKSNGDSVRSYCKTCDKRRKAEYTRTLRGNTKILVCNARQRSTKKGLACNLSSDLILNKILDQQGRCAYSGVQMELLLPHSDWRMSLERVNNAVGYVPENCVLIAAEFNTTENISRRVTNKETAGSSKWSLDKVQHFGTERLLHVDLQVLGKSIKAARERYQSLPAPVVLASCECELKELDGDFERFRCSRCGFWKPASLFSLSRNSRRGLQSQCKQCAGEYSLYRRLTLRGHVLTMLNHARSRHRLGKWHGNFEIDLDSVLKMLWFQQGRCFYSDIPLRFAELNVDWMMSLERLDNNKTYTKENTVLVALEFNSADHSRTATSQVFGSGQWSRRKVEHIWGAFIGAKLDRPVAQGWEKVDGKKNPNNCIATKLHVQETQLARICLGKCGIVRHFVAHAAFAQGG